MFVQGGDDNRGQSRIEEGHPDAYAVQVVAIDDVVQIAGRTLAIKMDVEGFEMETLRGGERLFRENRGYAQIEAYDGRDAVVIPRMAALGYTPASPERATLLVRFDYGVDKGRERVRSTGGFGYDPFWGPWRGYGRFGYGQWRSGPWGYGWYDPWFDSARVDSYTVYTSGISLKIDRRADNARLFEGKAEAVSTSNRLAYLVPNLVEAMFTDFPGNSGETVRISVAPERGRN